MTDNENEELKLIETLFDSKQKYHKVIQAAISKWVKDFQEGRIQISSVDDLRTLIKIDLELQQSMRFDKKIVQRRKSE